MEHVFRYFSKTVYIVGVICEIFYGFSDPTMYETNATSFITLILIGYSHQFS